MDRKTYIETVLSALRHVTRREREAIRAEIDGHIEDHLADLLELDYPPELAEERTLSAMGDPVEVGRELNEQYTGWGWVILSRVLLAALVAVCAVVLCSNPSLYGLRQNLEARKPLEWRLEEMGPGGQILDIRVPMGDDIWYIYAAEAKKGSKWESRGLRLDELVRQEPFPLRCQRHRYGGGLSRGGPGDFGRWGK